MKHWCQRMAVLVVLMLVIYAPATGAPSTQVWIDSGDDYVNFQPVCSSYGEEWSPVVQVVITVDSDGSDMSELEFGFNAPPGLTVIQSEFPVGVTTNSGNASEGEYILNLGGCAPACERREVARFTLVDFSCSTEVNTVLTVTGPTASSPGPVIVDCGGGRTLAPMGGSGGGFTCGVAFEVPAGASVVNPFDAGCVIGDPQPYFQDRADYANCDMAVGAASRSLSMLKAEFVR